MRHQKNLKTMKTAVVKSIKENIRSFDGKFGTLYVHKVAFDNGDAGEYLSQTETCEKFAVGQKATYTIEEEKRNGKVNFRIKPAKLPEDGKPFFRGGSGSYESFALSYSKDLAIAHIEKGKDIKTEDVLKVADALYTWLKNKQTHEN